MKIVIKNPAPATPEQVRWGDYHFGCGLRKALEEEGCDVEQHLYQEWDVQTQADFTIVLRGLHAYSPSLREPSLLWIISHPSLVGDDELKAYQWIACASEFHAGILSDRLKRPVHYLAQCTDASRFHRPKTPLKRQTVTRSGLLYVANSRGVLRDIVQWADESETVIEIIGSGWNSLGFESLVQARSIDNADLPYRYQTAQMVLNDHWLDMKVLGYVNNRIFDALACDAPLISDYSPELERMFGDSILYANSSQEFSRAVVLAQDDLELRIRKSRRFWNDFGSNYTFSARAKQILEIFNSVENTFNNRLSKRDLKATDFGLEHIAQYYLQKQEYVDQRSASLILEAQKLKDKLDWEMKTRQEMLQDVDSLKRELTEERRAHQALIEATARLRANQECLEAERGAWHEERVNTRVERERWACERQDWLHTIAELKSEIETGNSERTALDLERQGQAERLRELEAEQQLYQRQRAVFESAHCEWESERRRLTSVVSQHESEREIWRMDLEQWTKERAEWLRTISELDSRYESLIGKIAAIESKQHENLSRAIRNFGEEIQKQRLAHYESSSHERAAWNAERESLEARIAEYDQKLTETRGALGKLKGKVSWEERERRSLQKMQGVWKQRLVEERQRSERVRQSAAARIARLEKEIGAIRTSKLWKLTAPFRRTAEVLGWAPGRMYLPRHHASQNFLMTKPPGDENHSLEHSHDASREMALTPKREGGPLSAGDADSEAYREYVQLLLSQMEQINQGIIDPNSHAIRDLPRIHEVADRNEYWVMQAHQIREEIEFVSWKNSRVD